jgi:uncharacterized membrane protein YgcG
VNGIVLEITMRPSKTLSLSAILLLGSLAATAQTAPSHQSSQSPRAALRHQFDNPLLNDVVQMTRAQLSDATIIAYVRSRRTRLQADITANDLIRLRRAGVSDTVISFVASVTGLENDSEGVPPPRRQAWRDRDNPPRDNDADSSDAEAAPANPDDGGVEVYGGTDTGWYPYSYAYSPYWYDYSPYWGGSVFIGGGGRFHGGFHGGGGRFHGGHGGGGHPGGGPGGGHSGGGHSGGGHSGGGHSGGGHSGGGHH